MGNNMRLRSSRWVLYLYMKKKVFQRVLPPARVNSQHSSHKASSHTAQAAAFCIVSQYLLFKPTICGLLLQHPEQTKGAGYLGSTLLEVLWEWEKPMLLG